MRVLGIDPGLTRCGVAVLDGLPGRTPVASYIGVITSAPSDPVERRLAALEAALGALAAIFPWELGEKADPFSSAPIGIRPEWYFLAEFYTLKDRKSTRLNSSH